MLQWRYAASLLCLEMYSVLANTSHPDTIWFIVSSYCKHILHPLAGHILLSGSFWCLLPGLDLPQVLPLFFLSDYLTTICWRWLCLCEPLYNPGILVMQCFVFLLLFFHGSHLRLEYVFLGLSIFRGSFIFSVLKPRHCYFPFELSSILGCWIFYFRPFMLKHLLWILPFFVPPGDDWALLLLFWMLFLHQSGTFLRLLLRCIIIIIIIIILNVIITIIGRLKPGWHNTLNGGERNLQQVSRSVRAWVVLSLSNYNRQHI